MQEKEISGLEQLVFMYQQSKDTTIAGKIYLQLTEDMTRQMSGFLDGFKDPRLTSPYNFSEDSDKRDFIASTIGDKITSGKLLTDYDPTKAKLTTLLFQIIKNQLYSLIRHNRSSPVIIVEALPEGSISETWPSISMLDSDYSTLLDESYEDLRKRLNLLICHPSFSRLSERKNIHPIFMEERLLLWRHA